MSKFLVRKSAAILGMIGALSMSLFNSCTQDNPTAVKDEPTYSLTGFVLDGYSGKALGGAVVTYFDEDGDSVTDVSTPDGGFSISKIPYGDRSFFFSYRSTGTDTTKYTTAAVTVAGEDWQKLSYNPDSLTIKLKNIAGAVKLYPLSGSISGTVVSQVNDRSELNAVGSTVVKVTFTPKDNNQQDSTSVNGSNVEVGPRTFETATDATGRFSIIGLPVSGNTDDKVTIKVVSVTATGIDWAMVGDGINVELVKGQIVPVGQIVLKPIVLDPLVALANNFKTGVVTPEQTFEISYSAALDSVASYAVLYSVSDGRNVVVATTISGKKVTIDPAYSLVNGNQYRIKTFAYGLKGSSAIDTFNVTVAGGGLADVVSSNILTDTKSPVNNIGVKENVTFTFTDSIVSKSAKVTLADVQIDVSVSALNKTLTISPKSIWKNGALAAVTVVLSSGKTVSFSTPIFTENALGFVTSNVYDFNTNSVKSGLGLQDVIVFTTNKEIKNNAVKVIFKQGGNAIPAIVTVAEGNQQINIKPVNALKAATQYSVEITVENESGESKYASALFTTTAALFFPIYDNVRIGNDSLMPRLDFAPNANVIIQMNEKIAKATVKLVDAANANTIIKTKVTIVNDSIIIDPEDILKVDGTKYTLYVTAEDSLGNTVSGSAYVKGLTPQALVIVKESNIITADGNVVVNAERGITPWFKLSSAPKAASEMKALITVNAGLANEYRVDAVVSVNVDTLFVNPVADLKYDDTVKVNVTGVAVDGNYISFTKTFKVMKKPVITIVKSNVLNDNYEGLTNVAENVEMWYKLSRAVNAASITAKVNDVDAVVRVNIDTIFVKSVKILDAGTSPKVRIKGLDSEGLAIDLLGNNAVDAGKTPDWPSFTIRPEIYPVASNTWGVKGKDDPAKDFQFYDTMWVKFSQALSTDLNDIVWGAGTITADPTSNPNAKAWVNGDTLFVLPDNRVAITYNQTVSFLVKVKTTLGQVSPAFVTFQVKTAELNLFVKATNTKDANGEMRQDFGLRDTVFVVASVPIDSIKSVRSLYGVNSVNGSVQLPDDIANILRSRVRLSSSGDTIFYAPSAKLSSDVVYALDFTVRLKNQPLSASETNKLQISWKTKAGVMISATNVMANITTFRSFKVIGDSLVVTFTKSIDTSYNAPTPFKVNGFVDNVSKTWSSDLKTVTIKNIDTLVARNYAIAQSDMTTNNTDYDKTITFNVTCADGEEKSSLGGENLYVGKMAIKTEYKCALVGSNTVENHTTLAAIANSETHKDTFAVAGNPTLVFSRAIDTNKVKADIINLYQNFIQLRKTTLPLEFAISFSSDAKTVTINPVANLAYSTEYNIVITNIPVVGLKDAFSGTGGASSILTAYDFKTVNPSPVFLTGKATTIFVDSQSTTLRYAYTPVNTEYGAGTVAAGNFKVKIQKTAWNANYADSVTGYEFRIRNSADGTVWSGWTTLATKAGAGTSYDPLDLQVNGTSRFYQYNIDVATDPSGVNSSLLIPDGGLSYTNNDNMLNKATMVQIIARAYKNNSGANSYAEWSSPVTFSDNVAPGDPDFGRTNINVTPTFTTSFDRAANATVDSSNYIDVDFPEDMNVATVPSIVFYDGRSTGLTAPSAAANSGWQNARKYRFYIKLASGVNYAYSAGVREWYLKISVVGMKDYSGVTLVSSGTAAVPAVGAPWTGAAGVAVGSTTASVRGNLNVGAGNGGKDGLYLLQ